MNSPREDHPTVRPHALALGVIADPGGLGDGDLERAMFTDALVTLRTFPVRHRAVFIPESAAAEAEGLKPLPPAWGSDVSAVSGATAREQAVAALEQLLASGCEAGLVVFADVPTAPLGDLFDLLMWLIPGQRIGVGIESEKRSVYAVGISKQHGDAPVGALLEELLQRDVPPTTLGGLELKMLDAMPRVRSVDALRALDPTASSHLTSTRAALKKR